MDWGLVILLVLGGLVSAGFGWIAIHSLPNAEGSKSNPTPDRDACAGEDHYA
jgi:hypothetical protein